MKPTLKSTIKRTPQRSLLRLSLLALIWGAALVVAAGLGAEPALLLTVWGAGASLLVLLAFYLGLSFRLDLLQVQQALREAIAAPDAQAPLNASLAAFWQPLIDAASAARQPVEDAAREKAQIAAQTAAHHVALQSALEAERAQSSAWQRQATQAQAELALLRKQAQDAARAVAAAEAEAEAAAAVLPDPREAVESAAREQREQQQAAWAELNSLASSLAAEIEAQIGAAAQFEATAQAQAAARADRLAQTEAGQRRSAGELAQTAEALALLGLNLRLQLSHLAASPAAAELLEQTEADLDALLGALVQPKIEPGSAAPAERPASTAGQDPWLADSLAPLLARLRAVSAQAAQKNS